MAHNESLMADRIYMFKGDVNFVKIEPLGRIIAKFHATRLSGEYAVFMNDPEVRSYFDGIEKLIKDGQLRGEGNGGRPPHPEYRYQQPEKPEKHQQS